MDPATISLLMGGAGMLGNMLGGNAQRDQANQGLLMQKALADEQMRFAKSSRTDAYGNKVSYDDAMGGWRTDLDPTQSRIIKAGETEQLTGLTRDAATNRGVRERAASRGMGADADYARTNAAYKYGPSQSEGSIEDQLSRLMALSTPALTRSGSTPNIRTAGNVPVVYSGGGTTTGPETGVTQLAKLLMQARGGALSEASNRATQRNSKYLPALQEYDRVANGGGGAPINYSTTPNDLRGTEGDMAKLVSSASASAARNIGGAENKLTDVSGKGYPNVGDMSKIFGMMKPGITGKAGASTKTNVDTPEYYGGSPETNSLLNPSSSNYYTDDDWKTRMRQQALNEYGGGEY